MTMPKAYIGLFKDNTVAVFDTGAKKVLTTIPIPTGPHGLVVTPDGKTVYVSSDGASTVSVIDTATDKVTATIEVGQTPHGLAITPDGKQVLVAGFGTNQVSFIDVATNKVVGQVAAPQPHNIAVSPDGKLAYVAAQQQGMTALTIVDIAAKAQMGSVPLDKTPRAIGSRRTASNSPSRWRVWTPCKSSIRRRTRSSHRFRSEPRRITRSIPPLAIRAGRRPGAGRTGDLQPENDKVTTTVKVGTMPHWIAASADGDTAYVTNEVSNDLSIVDVEGGKVIATVPIGNAPRKIVLQPEMTMHAMATPATGAAAAPATNGTSVTIASFAFAPQSLSVAPGQTVTWTNQGQRAAHDHRRQGRVGFQADCRRCELPAEIRSARHVRIPLLHPPVYDGDGGRKGVDAG